MVDPYLNSLLETPLAPIADTPESSADAGRRASKIWLPDGKRHWSKDPGRDRNEGKQIDLEEAIEAAGGLRGAMRA